MCACTDITALLTASAPDRRAHCGPHGDPSSWIHLGHADMAVEKPVPNCAPVSSSAQQGAIANQTLIKGKQALDLEKSFSVLGKTMSWARQLFYQLLKKQILHVPTLPASSPRQHNRARRAHSILCSLAKNRKCFTLFPSKCSFLE